MRLFPAVLPALVAACSLSFAQTAPQSHSASSQTKHRMPARTGPDLILFDGVIYTGVGLADGHWITGGRWDHTLWKDKVLPTRQELDKVTAGHPAFLSRVDGHIAIANSSALAAASITGKTVPPQGGAIDLDAKGEPTGIL